MPIRASLVGEPALSAFTLLEVLAVLAIIAILVSLGFGAARRASEAGRTARARSELLGLSAALDSYQRTLGDYPHTNDPTMLRQALLGRRGPRLAEINGRAFLDWSRFSAADQRDPFSDSTAALLDPWGQAYRYVYRVDASWVNPRYVLYSAGPDGRSRDTLRAGGFPDDTAPENHDNLYVERP